ncbi:GntR family transcriptional regulator [Pseudactinotalea sp. HY160]|uniref:GntR family transcriptional regulator n=1 Tax=Pseudactinotalea sp. HY160 TaxID=2654490 RepID=UPI00188384AC|nr:GntR family transcriptional regulator [Pseudactinotalea sp. HY160]
MATPVERRSPVARWGQIARELRRQIEQRALAPSQQLPSENDLADTFHVSRITIRQALASLAEDGYVERRHGVGTFVSDSFRLVQHDLAIAQPWQQRVSAQSARSEEVPTSRRQAPPRALLSDLGVESENVGTRYFRRLQIVNETPIGLTESWLAPQIARGIEDAPLLQGSLSRTLDTAYGIRPDLVHSYLHAESASAELADALRCYPDMALIVVGELALAGNGAVISCSRTRWLGSRVRFHHEHHQDRRA